MTWAICILLAVSGIYLTLFRKQPSRENLVRDDSNTSPSIRELGSVEFDPEESDNWERFDYYRAQMLPAKGRYRINYEDQRGLKSERDIEIKRVHECDGKYAIDAHCLLRNAHRSFLEERIERAINLESGEIVDSLCRDAIAQHDNSSIGRALLAINKEWMGVAVLIFVCRADGQMRKVERSIVAEYLKMHCAEISLDDEELDSAIKAVGEPNLREFKRIIRDLKATADRNRLTSLLNCAKRIVETQKTIDPMETAALEILEEAVARA